MAWEPRRTEHDEGSTSNSPATLIRLLPQWYRNGRLALTAHDPWGDIPVRARDLTSTSDDASFVLVLSASSYCCAVLKVGTALGVSRVPAAHHHESADPTRAGSWLLSPGGVPFLPHPARPLLEATVTDQHGNGPEVRVTCQVDRVWTDTDTAAWPACCPRTDEAVHARP
ncbi:hypothetical protein [Actinomadura sp. 3N508]|uniref:hypothetical protein n=1 Tax=Actinomadura sp. 3N508 TaxID=3375153 RepID=UPI00379655E4